MATEVRAQKVTKRIAGDVEGLFPKKDLVKTEHFVVTVALQTRTRQTGISDEMLSERKEKHDILVKRLKAFKASFDQAGHWCDFIDPGTGAPFTTDSATVLNETDEVFRKLDFEILELGCCRAIANKKFGQCVVVGTAIVEAPAEKVEAALYLLEDRDANKSGAPESFIKRATSKETWVAIGQKTEDLVKQATSKETWAAVGQKTEELYKRATSKETWVELGKKAEEAQKDKGFRSAVAIAAGLSVLALALVMVRRSRQ